MADYHQQYLAKNPDGYCGIGGCGVPFKSAEAGLRTSLVWDDFANPNTGAEG